MDLVRCLMHTTSPVRCTYLTYQEPVIVLSGTRNIQDVLDDVDVRTCAFADGLVHCGMYARALRVLPDVQQFAHSNSYVHVTGWSLGGGCAVHLASLLRESGVRVSSITTFGAPRCADEDFAAWYANCGLDARTIRYVTPRDPVPSLPRGDRFVHVGRRRVVPCRARGWLTHHDLSQYREGLLRT